MASGASDAEFLGIEDLAQHYGWLTGLARRLVVDPSTADDLVQDTWLAAIARPPAAGPVRPWLARVLKNALRMRRRGERRRSAREIDAFQLRQSAAPDEIVARTEMQRALLDELLGLKEPYRTTILRRFFRGESSAAIARDKGLSEATVRSYVHRGLAELRSRLDERYRGRRVWVGVFSGWIQSDDIPLRPPNSAGSVVLGGATLLCVALGLAFHGGGLDRTPVSNHARPAAIERASVSPNAAETPTRNEAQSRSGQAGQELPESRIDGIVRDAGTGRPLHADVYLGLFERSRGRELRIQQSDPQSGRFSMERSGQRQIMAHRAGYLPGGAILGPDESGVLEIELEPDRLTQRFTFRIEADDLELPVGRLLFRADPPRVESLFEFAAPLAPRFFESPGMDRLRIVFGSAESSLLLSDGHQHVAIPTGEPGLFEVSYLDRGAYGVTYELDSGAQISLGSLDVPPRSGATLLIPKQSGLRGHVRIEDRAIPARGRVLAIRRDPQGMAFGRPVRSVLGSAGEFSLVGLEPGVPHDLFHSFEGRQVLLAGGLGLSAGEVREVSYEIPYPYQGPYEISGTVRDALTGRPLSGVVVRNDTARTVTGSEGHFRFPDVTVLDMDWPAVTALDVKAAELTAEAPGYRSRRLWALAGSRSVDLWMLPADDEALLASGRFTRAWVHLPPDLEDLHIDAILSLFTSGESPPLEIQVAGFERSEAGFVGWVPSPGLLSDVSLHPAGSAVSNLLAQANGSEAPEWIPELPSALRAEIRSRRAEMHGEAEAIVERGGETHLWIEAERTAEIGIRVIPAVGSIPELSRLSLSNASGTVPIRRIEGTWRSDSVLPGRYRIEMEGGLERIYRCRPDTVELRAGESQEILVEVTPMELARASLGEPPPVVVGVGPAAASRLGRHWILQGIDPNAGHDALIQDVASGAWLQIEDGASLPAVRFEPSSATVLGRPHRYELAWVLQPDATIVSVVAVPPGELPRLYVEDSTHGWRSVPLHRR